MEPRNNITKKSDEVIISDDTFIMYEDDISSPVISRPISEKTKAASYNNKSFKEVHPNIKVDPSFENLIKDNDEKLMDDGWLIEAYQDNKEHKELFSSSKTELIMLRQNNSRGSISIGFNNGKIYLSIHFIHAEVESLINFTNTLNEYFSKNVKQPTWELSYFSENKHIPLMHSLDDKMLPDATVTSKGSNNKKNLLDQLEFILNIIDYEKIKNHIFSVVRYILTSHEKEMNVISISLLYQRHKNYLKIKKQLDVSQNNDIIWNWIEFLNDENRINELMIWCNMLSSSHPQYIKALQLSLIYLKQSELPALFPVQYEIKMMSNYEAIKFVENKIHLKNIQLSTMTPPLSRTTHGFHRRVHSDDKVLDNYRTQKPTFNRM